MRKISASIKTLALVSLLSLAASAQTNDVICYDKATTKVTGLPFWKDGDKLPCMYAGTIKSSLTDNHNLFYWLFKNEQKTNAPLVLWLNGGPGASSMFGLFMENGPLRVEKNGTGSGDFKIGLPTDGEGSWLDEADLLFLDQPVNTGFSYGDTYATTMN
jgi:carboxypeptidase C (cathepsin A)